VQPLRRHHEQELAGRTARPALARQRGGSVCQRANLQLADPELGPRARGAEAADGLHLLIEQRLDRRAELRPVFLLNLGTDLESAHRQPPSSVCREHMSPRSAVQVQGDDRIGATFRRGYS
jgi:hypothetical protein